MPIKKSTKHSGPLFFSIIPGFGQFIKGQFIKGVIFVVATIVIVATPFLLYFSDVDLGYVGGVLRSNMYRFTFLFCWGIVGVVFWLYNLHDAYNAN